MPTDLTVENQKDFVGGMPSFTNADGSDGIFRALNYMSDVEFWILKPAGAGSYAVAGPVDSSFGAPRPFPDPDSVIELAIAALPSGSGFAITPHWDARRFNDSTGRIQITLPGAWPGPTGWQIAAVRRHRVFLLEDIA